MGGDCLRAGVLPRLDRAEVLVVCRAGLTVLGTAIGSSVLAPGGGVNRTFFLG